MRRQRRTGIAQWHDPAATDERRLAHRLESVQRQGPLLQKKIRAEIRDIDAVGGTHLFADNHGQGDGKDQAHGHGDFSEFQPGSDVDERPEVLETTDDAFPDLADFADMEGRTYYYTWTPDKDFVLDRLPGTANAWAAVAFGGNGVEFGIKVAGLGDEWFTAPAPMITAFPTFPSVMSFLMAMASSILETVKTPSLKILLKTEKESNNGIYEIMVK